MGFVQVLKRSTGVLRAAKFKAGKHAPEIFMYAGIAGTISATVIACKKTKNMDQILDEHKDEVEKLKEDALEASMTMNEYRKEMAKIYGLTAVKTVRNYALPFGIGVASVASILHGHNMLKKWYVDTSLALGAVTQDYNNLYDNLVKEVGEEKAKEIKAGIITEDVERIETNSKGKEKVVKEKQKKLTDKGSSYTLRWCEELSDGWKNDLELNEFEIRNRFKVLENNIAVRDTGHLFWWEAVEFLFGSKGLKLIIDDFKRKGIAVPMMAGWTYDPEKCIQIGYDMIRDPESPTDFLIILIPDKNIYEFGKATNLIA